MRVIGIGIATLSLVALLASGPAYAQTTPAVQTGAPTTAAMAPTSSLPPGAGPGQLTGGGIAPSAPHDNRAEQRDLHRHLDRGDAGGQFRDGSDSARGRGTAGHAGGEPRVGVRRRGGGSGSRDHGDGDREHRHRDAHGNPGGRLGAGAGRGGGVGASGGGR